MTISGNRALTRSEMQVNATYIMNYLTQRGWSKNAVAGMLGNMETESTINPGRWQSGIVHPAQGYGLVQWTPSTNVTDWLSANGYAIDSMDGQLERIIYEVNNGLQWISTPMYRMTFREFKTSTESPEYLAQVFLVNYERPANQNQPERSTQARYWYDNTDGSGGGTIPGGTQLAKLPIDVIYVTQGEFGPITHYAGSGEELAIDFIGYGPNGKIDRYPLYAPFDSEVIDIYPQWAQVWWRNTVDVIGVNGVIYPEGTLIYSIIHDWNFNQYSVGDRVSQDDLFHHTGNAGNSFGDHLHLHAINDSVHRYPPLVATQLHIYDLFDTGHVKQIYNSGGYDWKVFDGVIPGGPGDGESGDRKSDIITMLMTNTITGWYSR